LIYSALISIILVTDTHDLLDSILWFSWLAAHDFTFCWSENMTTKFSSSDVHAGSTWNSLARCLYSAGLSLAGLSFWGEWSLSSTITHLNLADRELFITHLHVSAGYCFTFITFKEWFSVKSLTYKCNQFEGSSLLLDRHFHIKGTAVHSRTQRYWNHISWVRWPIGPSLETMLDTAPHRKPGSKHL
jgi:hypothetical protein